MGGGWPTATAAGGGCCAAEEEGGPAIRLKSLPLGFPDRGDGTRNAAAPPPITDCWAEDPCEEAEAVEGGAGGADIRLRSLPFPFGGAMFAANPTTIGNREASGRKGGEEKGGLRQEAGKV